MTEPTAVLTDLGAGVTDPDGTLRPPEPAAQIVIPTAASDTPAIPTEASNA